MSIRFCLNDLGGPSAWSAFPTKPEIWTETRADGTVIEYFTSPPVQYGKKAWRYLAYKRRAKNGQVESPMFSLQTGEGWSGYVHKTNWAGMVYSRNEHGFGHFQTEYNRGAPKSLYRKWYADMLAFLYAEDPVVLGEKLNAFKKSNNWIKQSEAKNRSERVLFEETFGKPEHGDLVLTTPKSYDGHGCHQVFLLLRSPLHRKRGLTPFIFTYNGLMAVGVRHKRFNTFYKVSQEAFDAVWPTASAHERLELIAKAARLKTLTADPSFQYLDYKDSDVFCNN